MPSFWPKLTVERVNKRYTQVMTVKRKTLVLLDGNALIHRSYHALPPLTDQRGETVQAVYGFAMTLLAVLEKFKPDYIAASFDLPGPTFRDELYAEYKATRVAAPDDLYAQIPRVKELVAAFNIPIYEQAGFEADDCVGTIARQASAAGVETIIVTGDNDALQLVDAHVKVFSIRKGLKDLVLYDEPAVQKKYGFKPEQIPDFKGLAGDASDNIPGVAGIGEKSATILIREFGALENIYKELSKVKDSLRKKLEADRDIAFLSKRLGTIDTHVPLALDLSTCIAHDYDRNRVKELFRQLGFSSLLKRLPGEKRESGMRKQESGIQRRQKLAKSKVITAPQELETFLAGIEGAVALAVQEKAASLFGGGIAALEIAENETDAAVNIEWNAETQPALKAFLEHARRPKVVWNAKSLMHLLAREGAELRGVARDLSIIHYLLAAGGTADFEALAFQELGLETIPSPARAILALNRILWERLKTEAQGQISGKTLIDVYAEIELPLIPILFRMEKRGVLLNTHAFATMSQEFQVELEALEKRIFDFAGTTFNLNSPKQLAEVLFINLKIPTTNIKKIKTGISTASTELAKLRGEYPIIALIEEYRELFKLKTTYLDALPALVDQDSRIHTTYHQTVAATGRLSSSDPNLQNIPARQVWSERIRGAFEASPGQVFVGADYSQIELRVAAHLSGDAALTASFQFGEDVHRKTAAVVFGVSPEAVTDDMRRQAKVFNFGILYGMGAFGLAQAADIDQSAAAKFIETYFKEFQGVAEYLERSKALARERGFVETELGRRRAVPEIQSSNIQVARAGERMAVNMPIQGLAADIMKLAMLAADRLAEARYADSAALLLQVHDELIFEVREDAAEAFAQDLKRTMEGVYTLSVPLVVSVAIGKNWGEI